MLACNFQTDRQIETKTNRDRQSVTRRHTGTYRQTETKTNGDRQSETRRHTGTYRQTETKTNWDRQSERQGDIQAETKQTGTDSQRDTFKEKHL